MPCYFLSENNAASKKILKSPFPSEFSNTLFIPFKKMRKGQKEAFKKRLSSLDAFIFAEKNLYPLLPDKKTDEEAFFNLYIVKALSNKLKKEKIPYKRIIIMNPEESITLMALSEFKYISLLGDSSFELANLIYEKSGASIPLVSGYGSYDVVLSCFGKITQEALFKAGYEESTTETSLGKDGILFIPKGEYYSLSRLKKHPFTLNEASLLASYDKKASFNMLLK